MAKVLANVVWQCVKTIEIEIPDSVIMEGEKSISDYLDTHDDLIVPDDDYLIPGSEYIDEVIDWKLQER